MSYPPSYPPISNQPQPGGPYIGFPPPNAPMYPPAGGQPGYPPAGGQPGYPPIVGQAAYHAPGGYPPAGGYPMPNTAFQAPVTQSYVPNVTSQPQQEQWMNIPVANPNCPPGLEYLLSVDQLLVHQKVEILEAFTGFESANKYSIKNSMGQKVYFAAEDTDCCTRNCCGPLRPFDMKIMDSTQREVVHLYRPLRCDSCFCPCFLQHLEVSASGNTIGYVSQEWSICVPKFRIEDASGNCVLKIEGPMCTFGVCGDVEFQVLSNDGSVQVGKISKQWSGLIREAFTDSDHFGISFPLDLDVNIKAVLLGACFLIDFMFFEKSGNKERDGIGMF